MRGFFIKAKEPEYDTQIAGALGAALIAQEYVRTDGQKDAAAAEGMTAYYGFEDGSGNYYIKINTNLCQKCKDKPCINSCPNTLFSKINDDYGTETIEIEAGRQHSIQAACDNCKLVCHSNDTLPCHKACPYHAIEHTW